MAKVTILGDALVVTSTLKLEDIRTIEKYRPKTLVVKGGEENKDIVFVLGTTKGEGSVSSNSVTFGRESRDGEGFATLTASIPTATGDVKEWAADKFGAAIMQLNKLEESLPAILTEIEAEKAEVMSNITIAQ